MHPPDSVGYKAVAVNVSDVGAMGGVPMYFTIALAAPGDLELPWIDDFYSGIERACHDFDVVLAGEDTSSAASIFVDVSMVGRVQTGRAVLRSAARVGDQLYVTGTLGASALGLELLRSGEKDDNAIRRHLYPQPRHRVGHAIAALAHAMIDISDGLSSDLTHIIEESGVSARIYKERLPVATGATEQQTLHSGEDYELLFSATVELRSAIEALARRSNCPITRIGRVVSQAEGLSVRGPEGALYTSVHAGYDHFRLS